MKILMLNYEYPPLGGGASPVTEDLCLGLIKKGHDVDVVTMHYKGLKRTESYKEKGTLTIHRVKCLRRKKATCGILDMMTFLFPAYRKGSSLLKRRKHEMIHCHFIIPTGIVAAFLSHRFRKPYIITSHGSDVPGYNPDRFIMMHKLMVPIWKSVIWNSSMIAVPSERLAELIRQGLGTQKAKIQVVPNGTYVDDVLYPDKEKIILSAGRLFERKGVHHIIRAMKEIPKDWRLIVAGDGTEKDRLMQLAKSMGLKNVEFAGWLSKDRLVDLYKKSSIFITPSSEESFGMSLVEAMNYCNAIVASDLSVFRGIIGDAGIILPKVDPDHIADSLKMLIADDKLRKQLQDKAKMKAKEFSVDAMVSNYEKIYSRLT
jgi:glycosyltransferase involved in cell wall biosynthesis